MTAVFYIFAAFFEIAGCYAFWMWLRLDKSPLWIGPGVVSLVLFALLLTRIDAAFAGRAYAAYGGVYVAASIAWIFLVEGARPDRWDFLGAAIMLLGAGVILFGPRSELNRSCDRMTQISNSDDNIGLGDP